MSYFDKRLVIWGIEAILFVVALYTAAAGFLMPIAAIVEGATLSLILIVPTAIFIGMAILAFVAMVLLIVNEPKILDKWK